MSNYNIGKPRLLIIDDNEVIHDDFRKIFAPALVNESLDQLAAEMFGAEETEAPPQKRQEFELVFASQGKEGLEKVIQAKEAKQSFSLAFVDMRMPPGWDGVETIEHLWAEDPNLQVVICTAYSDRGWDEILHRVGGTDRLLILKKPFDEIEVVQLAHALSMKRQLLEANRSRVQSLESTVGSQQAELENAQADAEQLIESISNILISLDPDGRVCRWNPSAVDAFGIPTSEAVGNRLEDLPIEWTEESQVAALRWNEGRDTNAVAEVKFCKAGGESHILDFHTFEIPGSSQRNGVLLLGNDVTHERLLQAQLDQAQRLESVGQLAAGVAHEINTPMQYIGDNVRYIAKTVDKLEHLLPCLPAMVDAQISDADLLNLRKELADSIPVRKVRSSLKQIPGALQDSIEGVEAVSRIVKAMKEFCHPGGDEMSRIDLNHVLESTVTVARNEWKYIANVETQFEDSLPPISGLPSELNQAFLNIIVNASHAIGDRVAREDIEKGFILIKTQAHPDFVEVVIEDNGGGIPEHAREKVFEPFFTTKDVGKGTGQGLAIAHSVIVQKHGGQIWFDVKEDTGTTFHIHLPYGGANDSA